MPAVRVGRVGHRHDSAQERREETRYGVLRSQMCQLEEEKKALEVDKSHLEEKVRILEGRLAELEKVCCSLLAQRGRQPNEDPEAKAGSVL